MGRYLTFKKMISLQFSFSISSKNTKSQNQNRMLKNECKSTFESPRELLLNI